MASRVVHLVDSTQRSDAVMLACADAVQHCRRFESADQMVMLVAHDGLAADHRARLLGLAADRVVSPRGQASLAFEEAAATTGDEEPCVCVIWGGDHAASLMMPDADAHLLVDLVRGRVHSLESQAGADEVARLPDDASLSLVADEEIARERSRIRSTLGLSDETILVMPLHDPAHETDGHLFAEFTGMLAVAGLPVSLLLSRSARHVDRAVRHWRDAYLPSLLLTDDPMGSFAAGADIGVLGGDPMNIPYNSFVLLRHAHRSGLSLVVPGRPGDQIAPSPEPATIAIARNGSAASIGSACMSLLSQRAGDRRQARRAGRTLADALREHESQPPTIGRVVADAVGTHLAGSASR
jgi:hypothetical protein